MHIVKIGDKARELLRRALPGDGGVKAARRRPVDDIRSQDIGVLALQRLEQADMLLFRRVAGAILKAEPAAIDLLPSQTNKVARLLRDGLRMVAGGTDRLRFSALCLR